MRAGRDTGGPAPACPRSRPRPRSLRPARAALPGAETTPYRWFHVCRVISTSSTPHVATTVPAIATSAIGSTSQDPVNARKKVIVDWVRVTATISTARTADVRTGSGNRYRLAGSSIHSPCPDPSVTAPSSSYILMFRSLPTTWSAMRPRR